MVIKLNNPSSVRQFSDLLIDSKRYRLPSEGGDVDLPIRHERKVLNNINLKYTHTY